MNGGLVCSSRNELGSVGDLAFAWASGLVWSGLDGLLGLIGRLLEVDICVDCVELEVEADEAEMAAESCHLGMGIGSVACRQNDPRNCVNIGDADWWCAGADCPFHLRLSRWSCCGFAAWARRDLARFPRALGIESTLVLVSLHVGEPLVSEGSSNYLFSPRGSNLVCRGHHGCRSRVRRKARLYRTRRLVVGSLVSGYGCLVLKGR